MKTESKAGHTTRGAKVLKCKPSCKHSYQDEKYGQQMRVHNPCAKGWTCTVCGSTILNTAAAKVEAEKTADAEAAKGKKGKGK